MIRCEDSSTILNGGDVEGVTGLQISSSSYCEIRNCQLRNFDNSISIQSSSSNITIDGSTIHDALGKEFIIQDSSAITISNSHIYNDYSGSGSSVDVCITANNVSDLTISGTEVYQCWNSAINLLNVSDSTITNNQIYNNKQSGVSLDGTDNIEVSYNTMYDNGKPVPPDNIGGPQIALVTQSQALDNQNNIISNNVIYGSHSEIYGGYTGIALLDNSPDDSTNNNNTIANNTIYNTYPGGIYFRWNSEGAENLVKNNIVVDDYYADGIGIDQFDDDNSTVTESYNNSYTISGNNYVRLTQSGTSISLDPGFTNASSGNFYLKGFSESIGAGENGVDMGAVDFDPLITPATSTINVAPSGGDYATIAAALNAISGNVTRTINVAVGTYAENVAMKNRLTLTGVGVASMISPASGVGVTFTNVSNATVSNLKINTTDGYGISLTNSSTNTLSGLTVSSSTTDAIYSSNSSSNTVTNCIINNSKHEVSFDMRSGL